jgi:tRNA pseudouridine55 synthase
VTVDGVLVVNKPAGPTSHDVVDRARQALGVRKVGHTGTLDPFATGVLPLCVGRGTRLARFLAASDKAYRAVVRLGFATTTDDLTGAPLAAPRPVAVDHVAVQEACRRFVGAQLQVPPAYAAKRVGGRRLYDLARRGVIVDRAPQPVQIHELHVFGVEGDRLELELRCSAGTYVRALARDLGEALGTGAHLVSLVRTFSAGFGLHDAVPWTDLLASARQRLLPLRRVLLHLPAVRVTPEGLHAIRFGRDLTRREVLSGFPESPVERLRLMDPAGNLLALAVPKGFTPRIPGLAPEPVLHPDVVLVT